MASIIKEYRSRLWNHEQLRQELYRLIGEYNKLTQSYLIIYSADTAKSIIQGLTISLEQEDYFIIHDLLREVKSETLDFYIETPGGRGEAAEEIARFLHSKFNHVNYVIAGEAKSAGTILALSGDDISMTDSGSLGPIDAQVRVGRFVVSAHDYLEWIDQQREEAKTTGKLNPLDAVIVAQISPGELKGIIHAFDFAKKLVKGWLPERKFKNWSITNGRKIAVTKEMRISRAEEIANELCDHGTWKSHGRSLKIDDLQPKLKINRIDDTPKLADIVYRIKTVIRLIFDTMTVYKIFQTADVDLWKTFAASGLNPAAGAPIPQQQAVQARKAIPPPGPLAPDYTKPIKLQVICPKCQRQPELFAVAQEGVGLSKEEMQQNNKIDDKGFYVCECGTSLDIKPIKSNLELATKKSISFPKNP
jgi:hypothetical protein